MMASFKSIIALALLTVSFCHCTSPAKVSGKPEGKLFFQDEFNGQLDTTLWISEIAPLPNSSVYTKNGQLYLDTKGGVTVWLNKKLSGDLRIEFDRTVIVDTGKNDRLSDLNVFWMATDPNNENLFTRKGVFEEYDNLSLYYVGMGGNSNKTTRFRKYMSNGEKAVITEYTDEAHLLQANKTYHITITVKGNTTTFAVDGNTYVTYNDPAILKQGYFGFRSTKSRQAIDDIRIYKLQ